eukprot:364755-Chlamydomonas_euryale.AAC.2
MSATSWPRSRLAEMVHSSPGRPSRQSAERQVMKTRNALLMRTCSAAHSWRCVSSPAGGVRASVHVSRRGGRLEQKWLPCVGRRGGEAAWRRTGGQAQRATGSKVAAMCGKERGGGGMETHGWAGADGDWSKGGCWVRAMGAAIKRGPAVLFSQDCAMPWHALFTRSRSARHVWLARGMDRPDGLTGWVGGWGG